MVYMKNLLAARTALTSLRKESHARWSTAQRAGRVERALATAVLFFSLPISADSRPSASMAGRTVTRCWVLRALRTSDVRVRLSEHV